MDAKLRCAAHPHSHSRYKIRFSTYYISHLVFACSSIFWVFFFFCCVFSFRWLLLSRSKKKVSGRTYPTGRSPVKCCINLTLRWLQRYFGRKLLRQIIRMCWNADGAIRRWDYIKVRTVGLCAPLYGCVYVWVGSPGAFHVKCYIPGCGVLRNRIEFSMTFGMW